MTEHGRGRAVVFFELGGAAFQFAVMHVVQTQLGILAVLLLTLCGASARARHPQLACGAAVLFVLVALQA